MTAKAKAQTLMETALRRALKNNELFLVYQPKFNLNTQQWQGMEALVRWNSPDEGVISPARFIPVAEQSGLMIELGYWVLEQACRQAQQWQQQKLGVGRISVNVSGLQLQNADLM